MSIPMEGLAQWLRSEAAACQRGGSIGVATDMRQWAAEVESARAALSAGQAQPVAWMHRDIHGALHISSAHDVPPGSFAVYAAPKEEAMEVLRELVACQELRDSQVIRFDKMDAHAVQEAAYDEGVKFARAWLRARALVAAGVLGTPETGDEQIKRGLDAYWQIMGGIEPDTTDAVVAAIRAASGVASAAAPPKVEHVCGLQGYNGMIDPPCPACEANRTAGVNPSRGGKP